MICLQVRKLLVGVAGVLPCLVFVCKNVSAFIADISALYMDHGVLCALSLCFYDREGVDVRQ